MRVIKEFEPKQMMLSLNKQKESVVIVSHTNPVSPPSNSFTTLTQPVKREADMKAKSYVEVSRAKLYEQEESL